MDPVELSMQGLLNVVAEGFFLFLACSTEPAAAASLRECIDVSSSTKAEVLAAVGDHLAWTFRLESVIFVGADVDSTRVASYIDWKQQRRDDVKLYSVCSPVEEILSTYSFLAASSSWTNCSELSSAVPHQITEYLLLGSLASAQYALVECDVIINASGHDIDTDKRCHAVRVSDSPNSDIACHFEACNAVIDEARAQGKVVLCVCMAGVSRSTTLVLAYLMARTSMTLKQAWTHVRGIRSVCRPNRGFALQLLRYEQTLKRASSFSPDDSFEGLDDLL